MKTKNSNHPAKVKAIKLINNLSDDCTIADIHVAIAKIDKKVWKNPMPKSVFIGTAIAAFVSFIYLVSSAFDCHGNFKTGTNNTKIALTDYLLYSFWTIIPPAFFFWEYIRLFPYKLDSSQLTDFKYTQELASKIWAALLFGFGIILYNKYGKNG